MKTNNITDMNIQIAQKLKNGDIIVYTTNNNEIKKLLENDCWTEVLGRKVKLITKIFGVITHIVHIDSINLNHKKIIIKKIYTKNVASILGLEIK